MASSVNALEIRRRLGPHLWGPPKPYGPDGWTFTHRSGERSVIVTVAEHHSTGEWVHASMTGNGRVPDYDDMVHLHQAVFGEGFSYLQFVPPEYHVNIHEHALHLWGRLDGTPVMPYAAGGTV